MTAFQPPAWPFPNKSSDDVKFHIVFDQMEGELWVTDRLVTDGRMVLVDADIYWRDDLLLNPWAESLKNDCIQPFISGYYRKDLYCKNYPEKAAFIRAVRYNRATDEVILEYNVNFQDLVTGRKRRLTQTYLLGSIGRDMKIVKNQLFHVIPPKITFTLC